ncbi:hypothetical protein, partial [Campylobacter jejuni]|uniref:hypothetical protein n=1 Tax=Campylobacter jejuni TaxID=197 RepID=UPI001E524918
ILNIVNVSISPSGTYLLTSNYQQHLSVYFKTSSYVLQQTIVSASSGTEIVNMKMLNDRNLIYCLNSTGILYH